MTEKNYPSLTNLINSIIFIHLYKQQHKGLFILNKKKRIGESFHESVSNLTEGGGPSSHMLVHQNKRGLRRLLPTQQHACTT